LGEKENDRLKKEKAAKDKDNEKAKGEGLP